ncbi:MAG: hypothetical protein ACJ740_02030 [Gaiellales bacterium]
MAELTNMETKLGEVMGLAMAAQTATDKVLKLLEDDQQQLAGMLERMNAEAAETERRCMSIVDTLEGKKTAIGEEARATKQKGAEMLKIYLDADADALDGFEFLTMAEAGEVGHWEVLKTMNLHGGDERVSELCEWALPIQQRHFSQVTETSRELAAHEDPVEVAS